MYTIKQFLNLFLQVFLPKNYNDTTNEKEVESRINEIMLRWPIDSAVTKDDFIRLVVKIYWNDSKYKPFVSKTAKILRYLIRISIVICIFMWIYAWLSEYILNDNDIRIKMHSLWILYSNVVYAMLWWYIILNAYEQIRRIIRHEIVKKRFIKNILNPFWTSLLIPFTWFIGSAIASILTVVYVSIHDVLAKLGLF